MTDSLSKERLEEIANWNLGHDVGVYSEARTMARAILAAYEQEPVAWTDEEELRDANEGGCGYLFGVDRDANKFADPRRQIMLYRHAQQPVVPEEKPMPKASSMHAIDAVAAIAEVKGWNACRAAMLQAGNSPAHSGLRPAQNIVSPAPDPIDHGYRPDCECAGCKETARICAELADHSGDAAVMPDYEGTIMTQRECYQAGLAAGIARVPDGYVMMPIKLTAENGAKAALSGEFSTVRAVICPECDGDGCSDCDGRGDWNEDQVIDWITIKEIYRRAVEVCALPTGQTQDKTA
ncbi:hypothetical protein [Raoultella ornithinolytica]|uniref:Uncharacterized protein n=1 Tax=Raoultella ornithinolytica TaxID=54291 RepID=A0A9Q9JF69_RAOOR|nr:hypothetical protein [Raoultella ornithinolytica]MEB8021705.1 hypothetical protein [Raoultella ornithinolytica]UXE39586.1 hypothetical protein N2J37_07565 [Raoultella ornithinolytica]